MKRIVCSLVLALSLFSAQAQSQVTREEMQALVQRVNSLEHELSYLKLSGQIEELNDDLKTFISEVNTDVLEIRLNIYAGLIDAGLGDTYERKYRASLEKMQATSAHIEAMKLSFATDTIIEPYTESELSSLNSQYDTLDKAYKALESAMGMLRYVVDRYNGEL